MARVVETRFRQGTLVCPDYPAAVNAYMPTALVVAEAVLQAMGSLVPDKTIAEGSGSGAIALGGRARDGKRSYVQYEIFAGGVGGRNGKDGPSATSFHLSNGKIAPVEIIESEFPTQVERFELLPDSGGRGRHRGGLGFVREYRILQDEVRFSMRTDKHALAPQGIDGGHPGGTGGCIINPGAVDERSMPSRFGDQRLKTGDVLRVERPGGGGDAPQHAGRARQDKKQNDTSTGRRGATHGTAVAREAHEAVMMDEAHHCSIDSSVMEADVGRWRGNGNGHSSPHSNT